MKFKDSIPSVLFLAVIMLAPVSTALGQVPGHPPPAACHPPPAACHPSPPHHPPHGGPGFWKQLKDEIKSEKTIEALENLHYRIRKNEISIRAQIDEAELDLHREMARKIPDMNKLKEIIDRLNTARGEMFRLHVMGQAEAKRMIAKSGGDE